ncbi:hypothetical protein PUNSTDRAFT_133780 [Punctularia strigosozonata HHB-11173 SS5]|uniref:uncharacterized protein n=1 Tax=Punctularia strigosozonata (strain HHB-11173) TaxID=741275 RepID=UPI0004417DA6|nr:uncharacterized protein PUNSTDRAFT_133780 [Punctularia strigosozonata HHB-11173 SS5]EIN10010.1 hypothetical protein PUNSTDRAFT_133780 [Punctularia strigosozonata HHB-11173 SS5]
MTTRLSLDTLPVELLYEVQYHALSEWLPYTSQHIRRVFQVAPLSVRAQYLIGKYYTTRTPATRTRGIITLALRYPLCTRDVLEAILRDGTCPVIPLYAPDLPQRLFRELSPRKDGPWTVRDEPLPLLHYLFNHDRIPRPNTNAHQGFALTMAVHAGFRPLISFLLENGADPSWKDGLAVLVAIKRKDLDLVKMLVERSGSSVVTDNPPTSQARKRKRGEREVVRSSSKRPRLEDRLKCNVEMLRIAVKEGAMDIVQYLREEKGCVPDMKTLRIMSV